ncbi:AAA family ATPase [Vitreoscilla stercoraria]|uniref:AAA family ATPase n=1 Tax=Vitreoscilla stercoraria TaxID=61 RepID=A0ABY4ECY1_VITST|nr:AAA family ATPase [Vitreoscilla stercoraria]UOO93608.1 AAA family ATPase [Vitreoscilla stercoraria]
MKIANINNLNLVSVAMEALVERQEGLPGLGVYYGPSGFGKTTTVVAVANATRAYYVQMRSAWSKKTLLEKVCIEMSIPVANTVPNLLDSVCEQLAASQRPLIIDEADHAVSKSGMVELIRDIYEGSQAPVMLVGEEMLPNKLKRFERFHGRVLRWVPAQPVSLSDARLLANIYAPDLELDTAVLEMLVAISHGSVRRVTVNLVNLFEDANIRGLAAMGFDDLDRSKLYQGEAPKRSLK